MGGTIKMLKRLAFKAGNIVYVDGINKVTKIDISDEELYKTIDDCIINSFDYAPSHKRVQFILIQALFIVTKVHCIISCKHDAKWKKLENYIITNPLYINKIKDFNTKNRLERI